MSYTTDGANLVLNWLFTAKKALRPTAWAVRLHTANPTVTGAVAEVLTANDANYTTGTGINVTFGAASGMQVASTLAVTHTPASATPYVISHLSIWSTATPAVPLTFVQLVVPRTVSSADPLAISIGDIIEALA